MVIIISILVVAGVAFELYMGYNFSVVTQSRDPAYIASNHIGYTELTLNVKQTQTTTVGSNVYWFEYEGVYNGSKTFIVSYVGGLGGQILKAVKGSSYDASGLQIQVGDVNSTSLVLWVKSTAS